MTLSSLMSSDSTRRNACLVAIGLLALARFAFLGHAPLRFDEIFQLIRAVNVYETGGSFLASWLGSNPSTVLHRLAIDAFGPGEFGTRFPVVVQSLVIVLATGLIARRVAGRDTALIAVLVSLALPFNFAFGRYAQYDIGQTCFFALGALFLLRSDASRVRDTLLSALFFALAFLTKFNSAIPQVLLYAGLLLPSLRDGSTWRRILLNGVSFLVIVVVYKIMFLPDLITSMAAWLSAIVMPSGGGARASLGSTALSVTGMMSIALTAPLLVVFGYAMVRARSRSRDVMALAIAAGLYVLVLMIQGRLAIRYVNLVMPFATILVAVGLADLWALGRKRTGRAVAIGLCIAAAIQCAVSYGEYARWEWQHEPFREIGAVARTEIEPVAERIFLPRNFPYNVVGIMQIESAWTSGVRDAAKAAKYHLEYSPHSFLEQTGTPTSRMLFRTWVDRSLGRVLELGPSGLKAELDGFMSENAGSDAVHESLDLADLVERGVLRPGDYVFIRDRADVMYPSLWPDDPLPDDDARIGAALDAEVVAEFHVVGTDRPYGRFVRIGPGVPAGDADSGQADPIPADH